MNRDFTLTIYVELLEDLRSAEYAFQTFGGFLKQPGKRSVLLQHDIDDRKENALIFARFQRVSSIQGTYYFPMVPQSFDPNLIRTIFDMGHEVGN